MVGEKPSISIPYVFKETEWLGLSPTGTGQDVSYELETAKLRKFINLNIWKRFFYKRLTVNVAHKSKDVLK